MAAVGKKLLEEQPQKKKKWTVTEKKEVMMCYFEADLSQWLQETNAQHLAIKTSRLHSLRTDLRAPKNLETEKNKGF